MLTEINAITQQLFQKRNLQEVSDSDLEEFLGKYPYSATVHALRAIKNPGNQEFLHTASLYINNPLWLEYIVSLPEETVEAPDVQQPAAVPPATEEQPLVLQSYHTVDYFASQGIRLQQAELGKDRLGQQLKSFTEWLKSMKKLPSSELGRSQTPQDEVTQQHVIRNAEASIQEKDILTEAMAEVWAKQGNHARAVAIYEKLSLLDPAKSAYFAAKIDQLK